MAGENREKPATTHLRKKVARIAFAILSILNGSLFPFPAEGMPGPEGLLLMKILMLKAFIIAIGDGRHRCARPGGPTNIEMVVSFNEILGQRRVLLLV